MSGNSNPKSGKRKLTKALRPKWRWVGVEFDADIQSRAIFEQKFTDIIDGKFNWRLFDCHCALKQTNSSLSSTDSADVSDNSVHLGRAIVRIDLKDYSCLRGIFATSTNSSEDDAEIDVSASEEAEENLSVASIFSTVTASGKIALVRKRMGLQKPPRKK
ncbi:MAG: hypothetical protein HOF90_06140 [Euryarchaeota archaeon]|jgi:hypothetical protein|nr:hypothetical protein [Euryarchaeota archaeon]